MFRLDGQSSMGASRLFPLGGSREAVASATVEGSGTLFKTGVCALGLHFQQDQSRLKHRQQQRIDDEMRHGCWLLVGAGKDERLNRVRAHASAMSHWPSQARLGEAWHGIDGRHKVMDPVPRRLYGCCCLFTWPGDAAIDHGDTL